jgi:ribosomal-protein-alanine N-acetyltransferase
LLDRNISLIAPPRDATSSASSYRVWSSTGRDPVDRRGRSSPREGLARQLLDLHLRRLAGLGARTVFLEVEEGNVPARRLYQRAGFRQVGRREGYYPAARGAAALILRRDLV